jgi:superfamily II DNA or RNA helicase
MSAFRGRDDVFAVANLKDGPKPTYRPVKGNLAEKVVHHLAGKATFGIYPLLSDHTTWFLAIDCDGEGAQRECELFSDTLGLFDIPSYLERSRSGQGMHCWLFFDQPVPAWKARQLGKNIVARARISKSFDRFFPSQDFHKSINGLGNLIALPFQGESQGAGNTVFLDSVSLEPFACQWTVLENLQRISLEKLEQAIIESQEDSSFLPLPLARRVRIKVPVPHEETGIETIRVVLGEHIEVVGPYPPLVLDYLKANSCFANPEWHRRYRNGDHVTNTPRFIRVGGPLGDRWILPRGLWAQLSTLLRRAVPKIEVEDNRVDPSCPLPSPSWERSIELKKYQSILVEKMLALEEAVLVATTGSGKTMMALEVMARRALPCLVLVHNRNLLVQWQQRIQKCFKLPMKEIGGTRPDCIKIGERVTVATFQSLARRDLESLSAACALVVVDECHHVPARSFASVMRQLKPRYLLGLTATAERKDQLEKLIFLYLGSKVQAPSPQQLEGSGDIILPQLIVRETALRLPANLDHHARLKAVSENDDRNALIVADTISAVQAGHLVLILTDRTDHCDRLESMLLGKVPLATLHGVVAKKREALILDEFQQRKVCVLIATRKRLGEGWDCPPLSTLILAMPISGRGSDLKQMIGRLTRIDPDKEPPQFFDYRDAQVPQFQSMFRGRVKVYQKTLRGDQLPPGLRLEKPPKKGKATLDYGPGSPDKGASKVRERPVSGTEQLRLF